MFLSIFEVFKIGIGPSSSHTVGPMVAAYRFLRAVQRMGHHDLLYRIRVSLHGSLAFTGKGHASDNAIFLGLMGHQPDLINPDEVAWLIQNLHETKQIYIKDYLNEQNQLNPITIDFDPEMDLVFDYQQQMPLHANGMRFEAFDMQGKSLLVEEYYSVGGGFVQNATTIIPM